MLSDKVKRVIIGTLILTIIINHKFPYLHIKHEKAVSIQNIDNSKHKIELKPQYIDNIDNEKIEEYKLYRLEIVKAENEEKNKIEWINFVLSFYGSGEDENGYGRANKNAIGGSLNRGTIASCNFPIYTKIYLENLGIYQVLDTGSSKHLKYLGDNTYKVDVFVPKEQGESTREYKKRIMDMGLVKTKGYLVKDNK